MNANQRILVVSALCIIAAVMAFVMLDWSNGGVTRIVLFYEARNPRYPTLVDYWGIYTQYGVPGIVLGIVAPLCLLAVAAYIALGARHKNSN